LPGYPTHLFIQQRIADAGAHARAVQRIELGDGLEELRLLGSGEQGPGRQRLARLLARLGPAGVGVQAGDHGPEGDRLAPPGQRWFTLSPGALLGASLPVGRRVTLGAELHLDFTVVRVDGQNRSSGLGELLLGAGYRF
jgi:hypothetical protein